MRYQNKPKLTDAQVRAMRDNFRNYHGEITDLAKEYKVSQTCIRMIIKGSSYRRVHRPGELVDLTDAPRFRDELTNCVWRYADTPFADNH